MIFFLGISSFLSHSQQRKLDRLEQYYEQGHYNMVYRKSGRMLGKSEYEYSVLPSYYRSMSSFKLMQNASWMRRHSSDLKKSIFLMNYVMEGNQWLNLMNSHSNELADMELYFDVWLAENSSISNGIQKDIEEWILDVYRAYEYKNLEHVETEANELIPEGLSGKKRMNLIHYAYEYMGVPYKWGGTDENGFDCSGFVQHVFKFQDLELPRVSKDQFLSAKTINARRAYRGDLVFFSNEKEVSHVGILVNDIGDPKVMIHSSSSKGISVINIETSKYWSDRLVGFGRVIQ